MKAVNFLQPGRATLLLPCTVRGTAHCIPAIRSSVFRSRTASRPASTRILSLASLQARKTCGAVRSMSLSRRTAHSCSAMMAMASDAVAGLVGIEGGVVSGVINLESSGVEAPDWRPRHDGRYYEARVVAAPSETAVQLFDNWFDPI